MMKQNEIKVLLMANDLTGNQIYTGRHFQNGRHNTAQIQHCPISTKFHI
jgi:hypothetical protein